MRRRTFLAGLGFAALQLAGCAAKPQTTPDYVLTYADNQPAGYPTTPVSYTHLTLPTN